MIKVSVNTQVKVDFAGVKKRKLEALEALCTIRNPEYYNAITFNRPIPSDTPQFFTAFEYDSKHIVIPRGVLDKAVEILGNVYIRDNTSEYEPLGLQFVTQMQMRQYQDDALEDLLKYDTGILVSPTGSGKTNIMIRVMQRIDQPTLILLHRDHLLQQWKERIKKYLGYNVGVIGEGGWNVKNITIAMIPTLHQNPKKARKLKKRFGLVIVDECHHIPAFTWVSRVIKMGAKRIYGCSATPKRKDGLQKLMFMVIGPIRHVLQDRTAVKNGAIMPIEVNVMRTDFVGFHLVRRNQFNALANNLVHDTKRNQLILDTILSNKGRTQLVLSDRIEHLNMLHEALIDSKDVKAELIIGSVPVKERERIFDLVEIGIVDVLLASSVADEGLDLPILDTLHLTFPTSNPDRNMQQIGRIRRPYQNKTNAVVYDYFDWQNKTFNNQFQARRRKYRANNFTVRYIGKL